MPSPFPGMDPYLEGPSWPTVHAGLIVEIAKQLTPQLRPRYVARVESRFVTAVSEGAESMAITAAEAATLVPDVSVRQESPEAGSGGAAVTLMPAPLRIATVMPEAIAHHTVEIRDLASRQLVTAIEVLSPTNKRGGVGGGHEEYLERRLKFLLSSAHLLEIDLLRRGQRVPTASPLPAFPYFVFLSRAHRRPTMDVWPISLRQPLPTVPVPLRGSDPDVLLNLQQALANVYDQHAFDVEIDYNNPPGVPLPPEDAAWAAELLKTRPRPPQ